MTPLRIGLIGDAQATASRRHSLARLGVDTVSVTGERGTDGVDAVFVASDPALRHGQVLAAIRQSVAVFAEWPPASALSDVQALVAAADEAGVVVGTSRPLRFEPGLVEAVPSRLVVVRRTALPGTPLLTAAHLADAADLCRVLTGSAAITRIEAHAERDDRRTPQAVAFSLRFQNGAYAQVALHPAARAATDLYACAGRDAHTLHLGGDAPSDAATDAETAAFLHAVAARRPAPVSLLDALQTLRLVEKLWTHLR